MLGGVGGFALILGAILGHVPLYTEGTTGTVDADVLSSDGGCLEATVAASSLCPEEISLAGTCFGASLKVGGGGLNGTADGSRLSNGTSSSSRGSGGGGLLSMGRLFSPLSD